MRYSPGKPWLTTVGNADTAPDALDTSLLWRLVSVDLNTGVPLAPKHLNFSGGGHVLFALLLFLGAIPIGWTAEANDELIIEIDADEAPSDELVIESAPLPRKGEATELMVEPVPGELTIEMTEPPEVAETKTESPASRDDAVTASVDRLWVELGLLGGAAKPVETTNYVNGEFSISWQPKSEWELRLAARVDGYSQTGSPDFQKLDLDYSESYVRYSGDKVRVTAGAQKIIWGRVDEIPPIDRLSVVDLSRFVLDDLTDRRRPTIAVRTEAFFGASKLDLVWIPVFRGAVLPELDSVWSQINQQTGQLLGFSPNEVPPAVVQSARFIEDAPSDASGWGARYTRTASTVDFGATVQRNRQTTPYYAYDQSTNTFHAKYPRAWSIAGDAALEAAGVTWRAEAAWTSDYPVTRTDFTYDTVEAINWGAGAEFHPGDGDTRVNLQIAGLNLINAPPVLDRKDPYGVNGSIDYPFAHDRWRLNVRFFWGLDEKNVYLNPKLSFLGWEPHELYLSLDYFDGADNTPFGFYEDYSLLRLGWRSEF